MNTKKFNYQKFISKLVSFAPRQLEGESKACDFLISVLKENSILFLLQKFKVAIPLTQNVSLLADGKRVKCEGCSFLSGEIKNNDVVISSLLSSSICQEISSISFNPRCEGISLKNYYFAPAICVSYKDISKIVKAKKIVGNVQVEKVSHQSANILVGNAKNPKAIFFAHYDSIKKGAIDNASGVAVMMRVVLEKPEILKNNLFVFSGAEELSYDKPIYWGSGFRAFELKYQKLIDGAKKIIVIDCVGNDPTIVITDPSIVILAFPVKNLHKITKKTEIVTASLDKLMSVYHSDLDDGRGMGMNYLDEAFALLAKKAV
ncbi:MAG: M28 family peptidase [Parcubacteria group bacterium]|jgi:hypothetical protein